MDSVRIEGVLYGVRSEKTMELAGRRLRATTDETLFYGNQP
jgi:hypothetical protein